MQLQKWGDVGEMEKYGKEEKEEKGKREKKWKQGERTEKIIDNYYLLRMILNKRFCFCIHFFKIDIQYIDKYSIERKCMPYIPKYGKVQTVSKDNGIWIWRVWAVKPIEAHTSPYGHGLHKVRV